MISRFLANIIWNMVAKIIHSNICQTNNRQPLWYRCTCCRGKWSRSLHMFYVISVPLLLLGDHLGNIDSFWWLLENGGVRSSHKHGNKYNTNLQTFCDIKMVKICHSYWYQNSKYRLGSALPESDFSHPRVERERTCITHSTNNNYIPTNQHTRTCMLGHTRCQNTIR